jgi:FADH2 O2-dependent halogenase
MADIDYDVGIIGGGPAGSAMARYLAQAGVRCVLVEGGIFPRPHVGESLVPATTRVFKELGFLERMDELGFVRKYGASWSANPKARGYQVDWDGLEADCNAAIRFGERPQPGVEQNYTYHVDRGRFDLALLKHADQAGAKVIEGVRVRFVDFEQRDPELVMALGRRETRLRVRLVIDASGRKALVGRQLGLRRTDPVFDQYAIHSWFRGYDRHALASPDDIHIHFLPDLGGTWVWQIPIDDEITSLGLVTQRGHFKAAAASRERFFADCMRSRADLAPLFEAAERVRPLTEEADYSYAMSQFAGDRYLLLGDAARFVDPIFSSGVSIALSSARFAARDAIEALERGALTRASFDSFETTMKRGVRNWYDFICLYYRLNVLFTHFIRHPDHRLDMLKLLQGDVYDAEPPRVLAAMREKIAHVEQHPEHMWHGLLDDLTAEVLRSTGG